MKDSKLTTINKECKCLFNFQEGVYVWGLYLDGSGWDKRNLKLCESINKVLYTVMPIVHIYAIYSTDPKDPKLYVVSGTNKK